MTYFYDHFTRPKPPLRMHWSAADAMTDKPAKIPLSKRTAPRHEKFSIATSIEWRRTKHNIPISKLADAAGIDRASLTHFLKGRVTLRSDAIERLMVALNLGISFTTHWKPPAELVKSAPGPAAPEPTKPVRKKRTRPNNKPRFHPTPQPTSPPPIQSPTPTPG